ncbi:MAG: invasion associated locus B family protein [Bauldia sp.]
MSDWEPHTDDSDREPPPVERKKSGQGIIRFLWAVIALLVVVSAGLGISFFTGAISIAQPTAAVPTPTLRPAAVPPVAQGAAAPAAQGAAVQAAAEPPKPIVTKTQTYGDWIYTCVKRLETDPTAQCSIVQQLSDTETKAPLFMWRIAAADKGALVGEWQTRTGIMVDRGITLDAGTEKPIVIPFQLCTPTGCQAVANLAPDFIDTLSKAQKASATVFPIGAKGIQLTLSVKGLPDALAALKQP